MKLITKFILIYLVVTVIVLGIGGYLSYFIIKDELDTELKWRFLGRVERVTYLIEQGRKFEAKSAEQGDGNLNITSLAYQVEPNTEIGDTLVWNERLQQMEPNLKMVAYRNVDGRSYRIAIYDTVVETNDITEAVTKILLWILGMQVIGAIGAGFIISNRLFKPFRQTLNQIKGFNLRDKQVIESDETNVKEFNDLNHFVEEMTRKAVNDYRNLKEFAENASHELGTPLAIMKGKLELLTETDLSAEQYQYVEANQRLIRKLSRLSESLALLTKIENHEFNQAEAVNITELIQDSTQAFEEFIKLNGLEVETDLQEDIIVHIHPVLADILWNNLFQNSIRHNIEKGHIRITLTRQQLKISNTGEKPNENPYQLFERFKKANDNFNSIGLGLSIIKRIVDQNNYNITYKYSKGWHTLTLVFDNEN